MLSTGNVAIICHRTTSVRYSLRSLCCSPAVWAYCCCCFGNITRGKYLSLRANLIFPIVWNLGWWIREDQAGWKWWISCKGISFLEWLYLQTQKLLSRGKLGPLDQKWCQKYSRCFKCVCNLRELLDWTCMRCVK